MKGEGPTLPDLLGRAAAAAPDRVAVAVDGGERLTYGEWERRSDAMARGLQRSIQPGDRVALLFGAARWIEYTVAYLAIHKAGAVAVPLCAALNEIEVRRILRDCEASAVVAPPDLVPGGTSASIFNPRELEEDGRDPHHLPSVRASGVAEILYVSRPLSRPAPIPRSHAALLAGPSLRFDPGAGVPWLLHAFPVGTLASQDALRACLQPTPVPSVVLPAFDPDRLCALLEAGPIPACGLHPSAAQALLDSGAIERHDVSRVTCLLLASGRVAPKLLLRLTAAFPRAALLLTDVVGLPPGIRTSFSHDPSRPGAIGKPAEGTEVRVTDEAGRPVEPGQVGRVWVSANPVGGGATGDGGEDAIPSDELGYLDDRGFLYMVSGRHDVVRHHGTPVLRAEVEGALREHQAVVDAAVLGLPDDRSGPELAAAVVADSHAPASDLQDLVRHRLGEDKTPDRVFFVDELPRNPAGAPLCRELRRRLALAVDDGERGPVPAGVEETVAAVWARVLAREDIGPDDDFFELGGHASAAVTVLRLLEDAFEVRVPPSAFFEAPTVAGVASAVARLRPPDAAAFAAAPVAFAQEGMLWHELFAPGCQNLPGLARRYRGPLDVAALGRAIDEIVRRHEALRTGFELRDGRLVQVVRPHRPLHLSVHDLTELAPSEREAEVERLVAEAGRRPFDLVTEPLFAPTLLRLDEEDHVLVIRTHHSVFDDWSVGVFRRQLARLYAAYAAGDPSPLPEPPLQFADFSRRQRSDIAGPAGTRQLSFWRRELASAPLTTQLPIDDPGAPEGSPQAAGEPVSLAFPAELHERLGELARRERATVFMTMLAAFGVLVQRYTGQDDLVLATVVANRNRTELEGLIGCFTKKVPLRLRLGGDPTFTDALARTRTALLGALSHQDLPFEAVVQDVLGASAASHGLAPHLAVMFQGVTPRQELAIPDVETAGFETSTTARRSHFIAGGDQGGETEVPALPWGAGLYAGTFLILSVEESEAGLSCIARGAFHAPAVSLLMESFRTLLADVAADPTRRVSELAVLDHRPGVDVLGGGSGPARPLPADTLVGAFRAQVRRAPEAVAVRSREQALTYGELDDRSDRLADRLQTLGAGPGSPVGTALDPSPELIVAVMAAWKAGAAWVGLEPADTGERLAWIVRDASLELVVGDAGLGDLARHARVLSADAKGRRRPASRRAPVRPDEAAVVFYGSRSSPVDRGVVLDHRSILNLLTGLRHELHRWPGANAAERRVCLCPPPTDDAFLRQLVALLDGHALHIPERPLHADPQETVRLLGAAEVDLVDCTPEELRALLDAGLQEALRREGRDQVAPVLVVGTREAVGPELWHTLRGLTGVRAHVAYGPPECAFGATTGAAAGAAPRGVGRPMVGVASYVLDPRGRPVPVRAVGELHVGGLSLARGYLDHPYGDDERFVERSLEGGIRRLYRTGQLARWLPDGGVELLGPIQGDFDLRGFRVAPARVRAALVGCPGVRDVDVALDRDERGEPRLVAHVVPDGRPPSLSRLRTFLWTRLPGYAWPSSLVVDPHPPVRGEVAATGDSREPGAAEVGAETIPEASVLGAVWGEALGVEPVRPRESYWQEFSFVEALARARDEGVPVPGEAVTRNRTIETLATALAAERIRRSPRSDREMPISRAPVVRESKLAGRG